MYLSSKKMSQFALNKIFVFTTTVNLLGLRYVSLRCDKHQKFDLMSFWVIDICVSLTKLFWCRGVYKYSSIVCPFRCRTGFRAKSVSSRRSFRPFPRSRKFPGNQKRKTKMFWRQIWFKVKTLDQENEPGGCLRGRKSVVPCY